MIAKTAASGGPGLLPEVLAFSSSLELDRQLLREDLVGSLAHLSMLAHREIVPADAAKQIHAALVDIWRAADKGELVLADEEDVHMAVEAELTKKLGPIAGLLHTARSRNDQVALDLRLHVREQAAQIIDGLAALTTYLTERAKREIDVPFPSYTHRQRAMPISLGYLWSAYAQMFVRDAEAFSFVLSQTDALPLGVGAIGGTSLPIDREVTRGILRFSRITANGLDTVGDRDFALDYSYAAARFMLHASRLATDLIDFTSAEFGYAKLDGEIACGSSMMPQKRNPDVFELVRGKSGRAVGNLTGLLVTLKGLPAGYNRDLQEDRGPLLETGVLVRNVLSMLKLALEHVKFDVARCRAAVEGDMMQATDLAEALVRKGIPFRTAYQWVGSLVRGCQEKGIPLAKVSVEDAAKIDPRFDADVLKAADPIAAIARKTSAGGTAEPSVRDQLAQLEIAVEHARMKAASVPRLVDLFAALEQS